MAASAFALLVLSLQLFVLASCLPMRPDLMFADAGALALAKAQAAVEAEPSWPGPLLSAMQDRPPGSYLELVAPLVHAVGIAYRSSSGPASQAGWENATIPGGSWQRMPQLEADVETGGLHGRTFVDDRAKRAIVAFRGICTDSRLRQCQVDKCFLQSLGAFGSISKVAYNANTTCDQFAKEFDYAQQADAYVRKVQATLPGYAVLLTGHSLGGALAVVIAAQQPGALKAVTFAPTAFHELLSRDVGLSAAAIAALPSEDLVAIGDPYDCMINAVYVHNAREGATTCLLEGLPEPAMCEERMQSTPVSASSHASLLKLLGCKAASHDWIRYEKLLLQTQPGGAAPLHLPTCSIEASVFEASQ